MYSEKVLDNGVRIVSEYIPYVRSVSIGVWVAAGSRMENISNNGISHFIEHMMFKGTQKRTAKDIAEIMDSIGGQINAFTGKECTCYYAKTLDTHIDIAIDVLADIFFNSKMSESNIDIERNVILEEINMYEDSPEELVHDILTETVWDGDPLGYPILGTKKQLYDINRKSIMEYMKRNYTPENTVIAVAGNFEYNKLLALISEKFGDWNVKCNQDKAYLNKIPIFNNSIFYKEKDIEQTHVCVAFEGIPEDDNNIYSLLAVNNIFGGGMSSRLFQKIREEKGLAYTVFSYPSSYYNAGLFTIYAGMNPTHVDKVLTMIFEEIRLLKKNKISKDELEKSKEQLKGNYILGMESTSSRMNSIGKSELLLGRIKTPDEVLNNIDAVTIEDINNIIDFIFSSEKICITSVGKINKNLNIKNYIDINF